MVERINRGVNEVLARPGVVQQLQELGYRPVGGSSAAFAQSLEREAGKWADLVRSNRIQAE